MEKADGNDKNNAFSDEDDDAGRRRGRRREEEEDEEAGRRGRGRGSFFAQPVRTGVPSPTILQSRVGGDFLRATSVSSIYCQSLPDSCGSSGSRGGGDEDEAFIFSFTLFTSSYVCVCPLPREQSTAKFVLFALLSTFARSGCFVQLPL